MDPRRIAHLAGLALLLPLAGCSLRGDVWFEPDAHARVDLVVAYETSSPLASLSPCTQDRLLSTLTSKPVRAATGYVACHLTGRTQLTGNAVGQWGSAVVAQDFVFLRPTWPQFLGEVGEVSDFDVTLHFPGDVVAASRGAEVVGHTVRLNDPALALAEGLAVTARTRPTLPSWLVPLVGGLGWGIALALGVSWFLGWLGEDPADPATSAGPDDEPGTDDEPDTEPVEEQDPSIWAPDA